MKQSQLRLLSATVLLVVASCAQPESTTSSPATPALVASPGAATAKPPVVEVAANALTLVSDPSLVCMVNNQFMGKPQIPVEVDGRTYYGCCEMCKGRLANDPTARIGIDPVSKRSVDKSVALMARREDGTIVYFENAANFAAYAPTARTR